MKRKALVPFSFVLELLEDLQPETRPMFGCTAVYVGEKIVLVLRDRPTAPECNGIWIATTRDHHRSLKRDLPSLKSIAVLGEGETGWQMVSAQESDFETSAEQICEMVRASDPRIGKVPKRRKTRRTLVARVKG